jgi:KUP system potassium uptake protein
MSSAHGDKAPSLPALVLGALGVVFGDIGTSPLYALKECFDKVNNHHAVDPTPLNVMGVTSLIIWALLLIVTVKYFVFVLNANKDGEGGVLALLSLAIEKIQKDSAVRTRLMLAAVFGAALLYGDGMITPAISVLSAVEGLQNAVALPHASIVWITVAIIVALFSFQRVGTHRVGVVFGPITVIWFVSLAALGIGSILQHPGVLEAFNPKYGVEFLREGGWRSFFVLGSVFLCVTGAESLYADMGHFGSRPIRIGWYAVVFPSLLLNYLGQGALLMQNPELASAPDFHPFFMMAPQHLMLPLVILATAATVIASQALITGVYSLTLQAIQMGYLPRVRVRHTSAHTRGQIYVPAVNWFLMLACVALVIAFGSSSKLAAAYGIAVTLTMIVTTLQFTFVARKNWNWSLAVVVPLAVGFFVSEICFFSANAVKILEGGWFPLVMGIALFTIMTTWRTGRQLIAREINQGLLTQEEFFESIKLSKSLLRVQGTAVFMSGARGLVPVAMLHNIKHNKVIHQRVIFVNVTVENTPYVRREQQVQIEEVCENVHRITGHYGFMQEPDVPQLLRRARNHHHFECENVENVTFFLGHETIVPSKKFGMALWREHLFKWLATNAQAPANYFRLPENRVVELGLRVRI